MSDLAALDAVTALLNKEGMTIDDLYKDISKVNRIKTRLKHTIAADRELRQKDREAKLGYASGILPSTVTDAEVLGIE